jgi:carbamoyltransferase
MQPSINFKIDFRESFRPFAPFVLADKGQEYFDCKTASPYMLLMQQVAEKCKVDVPINYDASSLKEKLNQVRNFLPGITHVDCSAHMQIVLKETNPKLHYLKKSFEVKTFTPVLINTSSDVREEPIVCTPLDAIYSFRNIRMDILVPNDFILIREEQTNTGIAKAFSLQKNNQI